MLYYAVVFLVFAVVAALVGFGGIAAGAASFGQVLFVFFLLMAAMSFIVGLRTWR